MLKCTGTELPHVHGTHCLKCAFDFHQISYQARAFLQQYVYGVTRLGISIHSKSINLQIKK